MYRANHLMRLQTRYGPWILGLLTICWAFIGPYWHAFNVPPPEQSSATTWSDQSLRMKCADTWSVNHYHLTSRHNMIWALHRHSYDILGLYWAAGYSYWAP